jgi:photosystem II stability/assembly factor-like uncharacterized protein
MKYAILLLLLFSVHSAPAQTGWKVNRSSGGADLVTVYFTSSEKGWIAGDDGYLAVTTDGGRNWTKKDIGASDTINEVYFRNDENGYLVAGRRMFITRDGGASWQETQINRPGEFRNATPEYLSIRFADKRRGIVVGSLLNKQNRVIDSLVMRTENGGETWKRVVVPSKKELFHLDFVGSSRSWIVGDDGLILFSGDGGASFSVQRSGTLLDLYNVDFRDDNEGYAVGAKGTILRTENGGATWEPVKTQFQQTFMRVDFADDKNGVIVGYDGTILRSSDRGRTWSRVESRTREHLYGLFFVKKYGWAVGAKGTVIEYER